MIFFLSLAGFFAQDCASGLVRSQEFLGERVIYAERNFFDSACTEPSVVARSYGTYGMGKEVMEPIGAREIDFTFEKITLEPKTEAVAQSYRARELCGLRDWREGNETEITGLFCDFFANGQDFPVPFKGEKRFGIVAVAQDSLRFGRLSPDSPGTSPFTRPRSLDPRPYFLREK